MPDNSTRTAVSLPLPAELQDLQSKRLLVTGVAGFIGGHLFRRLNEYGLNVVGTVLNAQEQHQVAEQGYQSQILDLADDEPWDALLQGVDIVFNIAAMFQEVEKNRAEYLKVNQAGALKLAKTAHTAGVQRFVHCSTVGVHGDVKEIPASESTPFNPMDIYHETKLAGELDVVAFGKTLTPNDMTIVVNRPAMVYGPHDLRMLKIFRSVTKKQFRMIGSGKTLAHLGYIEDQTRSFLQCAVAPGEVVHCQAYNIASGTPISLNEMVKTIAACSNVAVSSLHIPVLPVWLAALLCEIICKPFGIKPPLFRRRVGFFTHDRAFDYSKAQRDLHYESKWDHHSGLAATVEWYKQNNLL